MTQKAGMVARVLLVGATVWAAMAPAGAHPAGPPPVTGLVQTLPLPADLQHLVEPVNVSAAAVAAAGCPTSIPRSTVDREPDEVEGPRVHVVYLVPSQPYDRGFDTDGSIECSMRAMNDWMLEQSGDLTWRFDTFLHNGEHLVDVTYHKSTKPYSELDGGGEVSAEIAAHFAVSNLTRYLTFVESRTGPCGDAFSGMVLDNGFFNGRFSQVYMRVPGCNGNDFGVPGNAGMAEMIAQQELLHNDALVSQVAPHACGPPGVGVGVPNLGGHVCTAAVVGYAGNLDPESVDVMFPFVGLPLRDKVLDKDHDDYYKHPFPYLRDLDDNAYFFDRAAS